MAPLLLGMAAKAASAQTAGALQPRSCIPMSIPNWPPPYGNSPPAPGSARKIWRRRARAIRIIPPPTCRNFSRAKPPCPVSGGEVPVLIIDPKPGAPNRPATIYIHGGGFAAVASRADTNHPIGAGHRPKAPAAWWCRWITPWPPKRISQIAGTRRLRRAVPVAAQKRQTVRRRSGAAGSDGRQRGRRPCRHAGDCRARPARNSLMRLPVPDLSHALDDRTAS